MYSLILCLAVQSPADAPAGLLTARGGCSGLFGIRQAVAVRTHERTILRERFAARASAGCSGSFRPLAAVAAWLAPAYRSRSVTVARGEAAVTAATVNPPGMEARLGLVARVAVHRQLRIALQSERLTPTQMATARKALADPEVYSAVVGKIARDMNKQLASRGEVRAIGDGTLLRLLLDNIDEIIRLIETIWRLFG